MKNLKGLWRFLGIICFLNILFFSLGDYVVLYLYMIFLLAPILIFLLAWGSYGVGKEIQRNFKWGIVRKIVFSFFIALFVSVVYWFVNDIHNSIQYKSISLFHTREYLTKPFTEGFSLSGNEISYGEFSIVFVCTMIGLYRKQ